MTVYLGHPGNRLPAEAAIGMPVLISFASYKPWIEEYLPAWDRYMVDSGAYSELTGNKKIDLNAYIDFVQEHDQADAWAGLDDISGDWRRSLENYKRGGFPTMHEADPPELLPELVAMAKERTGWLGIGLTPPRGQKEGFVRWVCDSVDDDIHIHGWALRGYSHVRRINSFDSNNWWMEAMEIRKRMHWLTLGECLEIQVKRYQRANRKTKQETMPLFEVQF